MLKNKRILTSATGLAIAAVLLLSTQHAQAVAISVTPGATDQTVNGNCSLYEAVEAANNDTSVDACPAGSGADTISIPDGAYTISVINLSTTSTVSLVGQSRTGTVLNVDADYGINKGDGNLSISHLTVKNGFGISGSGDGNVTINDTIWENASTSSTWSGINITQSGSDEFTFNITDSIVRGNTNQGNSGAGLYASNFETINLNNVDVHDNMLGTPSNQDGAIELRGTQAFLTNVNSYNNANISGLGVAAQNTEMNQIDSYDNEGSGMRISPFVGTNQTVELHNSSVVNNDGEGGLFIVSDSGGYTVDVDNVTVSNNTTTYSAFFMFSDENDPAAGTVRNITIADNTRTGDIGLPEAPAAIGFISGAQLAPTVEFSNVLLSNNLDETTPRNCVPASSNFFAPISAGHNFSSDSTCSTIFDETSDLNDKAAGLSALVEVNDTWVRPLTAGAIPVNAGATVLGITTDQRGVARPQSGAYDIGAYEFEGTTVTAAPVASADKKAETLAVTGVITISSAILISIILAVLIVIYRDYRKHKQPLTAIDPSVSYTFGHHLKVVTIPLLRYRIHIQVVKRPSSIDGVHRF